MTGVSGSDPVISSWLRAELGENVADDADANPLPLLTLATRRQSPSAVPERVLVAWHQVLARTRWALRQSELSFIDEARRQGWPLERIARSCGLADAEQVLDHRRQLAVELETAHPSQAPNDPWTG